MIQPELASLQSNSIPPLVDTHCHLDDEVYDEDLDDILEQSRSRGVCRWINVGFAPHRWCPTLRLAERIPGMSYMLGVHPGHADEWSPVIRDRLLSLIEASRPVAIGEIGLDFFRGETNTSAQERAFQEQLDLAIQHELPAVIHMRAAEDEVLMLLRNRQVLPSLVFHSFEGDPQLRDFVLERGAAIGFGGLATRTSAADLRKIIRTIPLEQIVLETDSPYLIPRGGRGRRNVPGNVAVIARALAQLFGVSPASVAGTTTRNAERIFKGIGKGIGDEA